MADITSSPTHQINSTMKPPLPPHFDFGTPPPSPPRTSSSSRTSLAPSINFTSLSDKYSTAKPWYYTTIEKRLGSEARELLENYSQIPPDKVDDHVYKMRDYLWFQAPYPSIGNFSFLTLRLLTHPLYPRIVKTLSTPLSSTSSPALFLDLGCCVAQELRSLAHHASIPPTQLYGTDYNASFLKSSYKIFKDHEKEYTLIPANILDPNFFLLTFRNLTHSFAVIHASLFLHLFTWDQQLQVCENIIKLMRKSEDALFVGCMVGKRGGGVVEGGRWLHDEDSWIRLWGEVWERTGWEGGWKVGGVLKGLDGGMRVEGEDEEGVEDERNEDGEGMGLFEFSVERLGDDRMSSR